MMPQRRSTDTSAVALRLPLTDVPEVLHRLACDVAIYRLQSLRPIHDLADARRRYDDAIAMLTKVANGAMTSGYRRGWH